MEKRSSATATASASLVLGLLLAASLACQCHGARHVPAEPAEEEKPLRPQNVFGFGGFYPGPSVSWVFPGPNGVTPQVGFGGMPGSGGGGGGVVGIHGGGGLGTGAAAKKP